jgi:hypothetical protein
MIMNDRLLIDNRMKGYDIYIIFDRYNDHESIINNRQLRELKQLQYKQNEY